MKKFFKCLIVLLVAFSWSKGQTAFEVEVGGVPSVYSEKVLGTSDGGFVSAGYVWQGSTNYMCILKFDSMGNFLWGRYYIKNLWPPPFNIWQIVQTPDSGFCLAFEFESDPMLNLNSWAFIKVDKNGYLIANKGSCDWAPLGFGSNGSSMAVEKNTSRLFVVARRSGESHYILRFDSSLSAISITMFNEIINPGLYYIGQPKFIYLNNAWQSTILSASVFNTPTGNSTGFTTKLNTAGNIVWQKSYRVIGGNQLGLNDAVQIDSFYYSVGSTFLANHIQSYFHKTDTMGNTLRCVRYDSTQIYRITPYGNSEFLLFGLKYDSTSAYGLLMRTDIDGNIISAVQIPPHNYSGYLDTSSKSVLTIPYDTIPLIFNILRTYINAGCNSTPVIINSTIETVADSVVSFPMFTYGWNSSVPQFTDNAVSVTATNICVVVPVEPEVNPQNKLFISPNPASTQLTISSPLLEQKSTIELFDITGRKVFYSKSAIKNPQSEIVIPVSAFERGIYMVRVINEKGSVVRKVVLQ